MASKAEGDPNSWGRAAAVSRARAVPFSFFRRRTDAVVSAFWRRVVVSLIAGWDYTQLRAHDSNGWRQLWMPCGGAAYRVIDRPSAPIQQPSLCPFNRFALARTTNYSPLMLSEMRHNAHISLLLFHWSSSTPRDSFGRKEIRSSRHICPTIRVRLTSSMKLQSTPQWLHLPASNPHSASLNEIGWTQFVDKFIPLNLFLFDKFILNNLFSLYLFLLN